MRKKPRTDLDRRILFEERKQVKKQKVKEKEGKVTQGKFAHQILIDLAPRELLLLEIDLPTCLGNLVADYVLVGRWRQCQLCFVRARYVSDFRECYSCGCTKFLDSLANEFLAPNSASRSDL